MLARDYHRARTVGLIWFAVCVLPCLLFAFEEVRAESTRGERSFYQHSQHAYSRASVPEHVFIKRSSLCERLADRGYEHVPPFCSEEDPDEDSETPPEPQVTLGAASTSIQSGESTVLNWSSMHASSCTASGGWSGNRNTTGTLQVTLLATTTYTLACTGEGGTATSSVTIGVWTPLNDPDDEDGIEHLLISEVLYDLLGDGSQGSESGGDNEWVELHNPTDEPIDITNWRIGAVFGSAAPLTTSSRVIPAQGFAVVTKATTTAGIWSLPEDLVLVLGTAIPPSGLANTGDYIAIFDDTGVLVDDMSYGSNTTAFDPSAPDVVEGHSLVRTSLTVDTDMATDWADQTVPTPGS